MPTMQEIMDWLLNLKDMRWEESHFEFLTPLSFNIWVLIVIAVTAAVWYLYSRESDEISPFYRGLCGILRIAVILMLVALLLKPVLKAQRYEVLPSYVAILMDTSQSMQIKDDYTSDEEYNRIARAVSLWNDGTNKPEKPKPGQMDVRDFSRFDVVRAIMKNGDKDRGLVLEKLLKKHRVAFYTFNSQCNSYDVKALRAEPASADPKKTADPAVAVPSIEKVALEAGEHIAKDIDLKPDGNHSAIGDAIQKVLADNQGRLLAAMIVLTDGQNNSGQDPIGIAKELSGQKIPVYTVGIGTEIVPKNIQMLPIKHPRVVPVGDRINVTATIKTTGFEGDGAKAEVEMLLKGISLEKKTIVLPKGTQKQTVDFNIPTDDKMIGKDQELVCKVDIISDEADNTDNVASSKIDIIRDDIKILYIEQFPRWEYRYLLSLLLRDKSVHVAPILQSADPKDYIMPDTMMDMNSPRILPVPADTKEDTDRKVELAAAYKKAFDITRDGFPAKYEDLRLFDLMIIGDVAVEGATPDSLIGLKKTDMENIKKFVEEGKGIIFIAGPMHNPVQYKDTTLEQLMPVYATEESELASLDIKPDENKYKFRLTLTPEGEQVSFLKLKTSAVENRDLYSKLPPFYWFSRITRVKEGATVLALNANVEGADTARTPGAASNDLEDRYTKRPGSEPEWPVLVSSYYGNGGRVVFSAVDDTWRWRYTRGNKYHVPYWQQLTRYTLQRKAGDDYSLFFDKDNYDVGQIITVHGRAVDKDGKPLAGITKIPLMLKIGNDLKPMDAPYDPGNGRIKMTFPAKDKGLYEIYFKDKDTIRETVFVDEPKLESGDRTMNRDMLMRIAADSGGKFYYPDEAGKMAKDILNSPLGLKPPIPHPRQSELWQAPLWLVAICLLAGLEWIMRKRRRML